MGIIIDIQKLNQELIKLYDHPVINRGKIKSTKLKIQATIEGSNAVTNTYITQQVTTEKKIDKNNYKNYPIQLKAIYDMYKGEADYGSELVQAIIYTIAVFIAGEGVSAFSKNPKTQEYLDKFIKNNKLESYGILGKVETGLLEGKNLLTLTPVKKEKEGESFIKLNSFSYYEYKYALTFDEISGEFENAKYKIKDKDKEIISKQAVFVKLAGTECDNVNTTNRLHCCLTQIENFSRAAFDLRNNSHLFGKLFPYFKFDYQDPDSDIQIQSLKKDLNAGNFKPGTSYVGKADFDLKTPGTGAQEVVEKDMLTSLKIISINTGIPIFLLAWPELMSNRAVSETMLEQINSSTKKERAIWEDAIKEAIKKSMVMAIDAGFERESIIDEFYVKIPLVTLFMLEMITKVWQPLMDAKVISMDTLRNQIPGINPADEKKLLNEENEERKKQSPFENIDMSHIETNDEMADTDDNGENEDLENGNT